MPRRPPLPGPNLYDAHSAAWRLAVAPFAFQAARAARELGVLGALREGVPASALGGHLSLPDASVATLLDALLAVGLVAEASPGAWTLTTTGAVWLDDPAFTVESEFTHVVCWHGLADLTASLRTGTPVGLARWGPWTTVYEGLSSLPDDVRAAWFAYDHAHSDSAFPACLRLLREHQPRRLLDVGGNTGRFARAALGALPELTVTLLDHPGQASVASQNLVGAGVDGRFAVRALDLLDHAAPFPPGQDVVWMSQFLDCFGPSDAIALLRRAREALAPGGEVWVLDCCPDRQAHSAAADSLRLASLYFTAVANGVSRFYRGVDLEAFAGAAGLRTLSVTDGLGTAHTLLRLAG